MNVPVNHPLLMLDPDVLRSFVAIAETGSFTAAAARIYRTPSAVSMQIKRLEEQLGVSVFLRDARKVSLTHDGEVLLGYARRLIALNREAMSRFVSADVSGVVRIGSPSDYGETVLPSVLKLFAQSHPSVAVDVVIDVSSNLTKRFALGHIDIALVSCARDDQPGDGEVVMRDDIVWAGAKGGQAHLLDPLPVSMWEEGCIWREHALSALEKVGRSYRVAFMTSHSAGQRAAILSDLAVAPMGRSFLRNDVQILDEDCGLPSPGAYQLLLKVAADPSPQVAAFSDHFRAGFERFNQTGSFDL
ncbi:LysR substrate-binding domain-containing protein [Hoeflea sp. YIM 152468]|uniref:LysR family transcriptional regulator n=1 Tax=Hoeflea sp. YIM 152468 TaxID=3031759 RepID=UPI0023DB0649|nr:LysR family transcriptional regulator [Hoeflea sp. YIM 152468]MDF1607592.1 LysR substrate-binding domain-containing protein [Hoeflea sp. YIM 152468]